MSVILNTDNLLDAVRAIAERDGACQHVRRAEALAEGVRDALDALAEQLAEIEGVALFDVSDQGYGFGGLCASFIAGADGKTSDLLHKGDEGGEW